MSYALFAQRKLVLTGLLNGLQLQQTQRSNEQMQLATNTLSLQQQLTSLQTAQSRELAKKYEKLAEQGDDYVQARKSTGELVGYYTRSVIENNIKKDPNKFKDYQEKGYVVLGKSTTRTEDDDLSYFVGINKYSDKLAEEREKIQWQIQQLEMKFKQEEDVINRKIYQVSIKENAIEMEVKRIDTKVTAIQKQLEAIEEAEGAGIDRATPKFNGIG